MKMSAIPLGLDEFGDSAVYLELDDDVLFLRVRRGKRTVGNSLGNDKHLARLQRAEGTVLPLFQAEGVRLDLSKRTKEPMNFWHRNMDCDELIFCYKGAIHWETELGNITLQSGEMFVIPKGIAHRSLPPPDSQEENIIIELKINGAISKLI